MRWLADGRVRCTHTNWHSPRVSLGRSARTGDRASQIAHAERGRLVPMTRLPSLYKCRGVPVKSPVCAICLDRTRGMTRLRQLTHGVRVSLCEIHNSVEFMRSNAGRDFVVTLLRMWGAQGCLTQSRSRRSNSHLEAVRAPPAGSRAPDPARMRGRVCAARPKCASRAATTCWPRSDAARASRTRPCDRAERAHDAAVVLPGPLAAAV